MDRLSTPGTPFAPSVAADQTTIDASKRITSARAAKRSSSPARAVHINIRPDEQTAASTSLAASGSTAGYASWLHPTAASLHQHLQQTHIRRTSLTPANNDTPYSPVVGGGRAAGSPVIAHARLPSTHEPSSWREWARSPLHLTGKVKPRTSLWDSLSRIPDLIWVELQNPSQKIDLSDADSGPDEKISLTSRNKRRKARSSGHNILKVIDKARKPLGITRSAFLLLIVLLFAGLYELQTLGILPTASVMTDVASGSLRLNSRDPYATLQQAGIPVTQLLKRQAIDRPAEFGVTASTHSAPTSGTAAILLNWKRLDNLITVVSHLCLHAGGIFDAVHIWNNNPDTFHTQQTFAAARCPPNTLRIYNSPANWLFASRYMACAETESAYCYFQDDDWLVPSLPAMHAHFMRDPQGAITVAAGDEYVVKEGWEWCAFSRAAVRVGQAPAYVLLFADSGSDLNTCFAWLGTGAFVSRQRVLATLTAITLINPDQRDKATTRSPSLGAVSASLLSLLDNGFSTLQNEPPYVIAGKLHPLPQPAQSAFTAGSYDGNERNDLYIHQSLDLLATALKVPPDVSGSVLSQPLVMVKSTHASIADIPGPHPYKHHSRAVASDNGAIFMTNIPILPPPEIVPYQPNSARNLYMWESRLSNGTYNWSAGKDWALQFPYVAAVDNDLRTAFRSTEPMQPGDFVGLDLLSQIDADVRPKLSLELYAEEGDSLKSALRIEVSDDGKRWQAPSQPTQLSCKLTSHYDTRPATPFPSTFLTSPQALRAIQGASGQQSGTQTGWSSGQKRLQKCSANVAASMGGSRRKGWRFVRVIADAGHTSLGWAIYEMRLT